MTFFRRACRAFALVLAMTHVGALSAAMVANAPGALAGPECCVAGARAGAMCPLHKKHHAAARSSSSDLSTCRLSCAASANTAMLLPGLPLPVATPSAPMLFVHAVGRVLVPALSDIDLQTLSPPPRS